MTSFQYFFNNKFGFDSNKSKIELLELNLRKQLHQFEFKPLKTKESIEDFKNEILLPTYVKLLEMRNDIKGFSSDGCLLGVVIYNTSVIYYKKVLLNEMGKNAKKHINNCALFGIICGFLIGYTTSYSFSVYLSFRKAKKNLENLVKDYDYFYVMNHGQEFDE